MIRLTSQQVRLLHEELIAETGGLGGVRDEGLLGSAINNHPFVDGNKRIGVHTMLVFLALNGVELSYTQSELIAFGLSVADSSMSCDQILQWIMRHQR